MWTTIQIVLGLTAILLVLGSDKLSMPILGTAAMVCFGLTAMAFSRSSRQKRSTRWVEDFWKCCNDCFDHVSAHSKTKQGG